MMRTKQTNALLALLGLTFLLSGGPAVAQTTVDKQVNATLPYPIVISEKTLEPGKYTLREISNHVIQVYEGDKMRVEATVNTIDTEDKQPAKETRLILDKFPGTDNFYISKMWIQGRATGWEFPLPERFKTLKHEREESLAGQYEEKHHEAEGLK